MTYSNKINNTYRDAFSEKNASPVNLTKTHPSWFSFSDWLNIRQTAAYHCRINPDNRIINRYDPIERVNLGWREHLALPMDYEDLLEWFSYDRQAGGNHDCHSFTIERKNGSARITCGEFINVITLSNVQIVGDCTNHNAYFMANLWQYMSQRDSFTLETVYRYITLWVNEYGDSLPTYLRFNYN